MGKLKVVLLLLGVLISAIPFSYGLSVSCMMVYDEGGAPAVFRSPECPDWVLSPKSHQNQIVNCQFATTQGRRRYQEDRISCNLDMQIPLLGKNGPKDVRVGVVAVFDGHIGEEASEMASKLLLDYFLMHSVFGSFKDWLALKEEDNMVFQNNYKDEPEQHKSTPGSHSSEKILPVILDGSTHMGILKQALLRTIHDIDSTFTKEALEHDFASGSTAVIALLVDGQILVANVGDSKALLCSEKLHTRQDADGTLKAQLSSKELTTDHNLHRKDERDRVEAAGGHITEWNPPLINGHFPMTRAIGDVPLKMYGITSEPEVTDWQTLTANDSYLLVASDGIFESLEPKDVCDLLQHAHFRGSEKLKHKSSCSSLSSLADCIVRNAYKKGSTDNLSAVVVPLRSAGFNPRTS